MALRRLALAPRAVVRGRCDLCYASRGFSLHAATRVEADDRAHLERLCKYV